MATIPDHLIPLFNLEAEMGVLGSMILSTEAAEEMGTMLRPEDFYRPAHRTVFEAMRRLTLSRAEIDIVTLKDELMETGQLANIGGVDYLIEVADYVPSPKNAKFYAKIVLDKATLRRLETAARSIVGIVHEPDGTDAQEKVDRAEREIFEVGQRALGDDFVPIKELASEFFKDVDDVLASGKPKTGHPSGFLDLDRMTSGFYGGDFDIIGARPSMGKTSLALDFALNIARGDARREGLPVAIFSLEMSGLQLTRRMVSTQSGISMGVLRRDAPLQDHEYNTLAQATDILYNLPIYIDDKSDVTPIEMRGKCRRLKNERGLGMIVVDYLQLMRGDRRNDNRVQELGEIARSLKAMAKELDVPVIALSQLSRAVESRDDKRPQLSDLRESGSIEAEADLVMLLYRESYYKAKEEKRSEVENYDEVQVAEVIIAKHRNGPVGKVKLGFQPAYARFRNLDQGAAYMDPDD